MESQEVEEEEKRGKDKTMSNLEANSDWRRENILVIIVMDSQITLISFFSLAFFFILLQPGDNHKKKFCTRKQIIY